jgi:hypothetical protein
MSPARSFAVDAVLIQHLAIFADVGLDRFFIPLPWVAVAIVGAGRSSFLQSLNSFG